VSKKRVPGSTTREERNKRERDTHATMGAGGSHGRMRRTASVGDGRAHFSCWRRHSGPSASSRDLSASSAIALAFEPRKLGRRSMTATILQVREARQLVGRARPVGAGGRNWM